MIHTALISPLVDAVEHLDRLRTLLAGDGRAVPECLHGRAAGLILQIDVRGQRVHEPADLASTHGVGLAR